ncbi:MAG: polysaccharide biosynthesis C-terminal domain-containing protein [Flavisolibacter sp.]
MKSRSFFKGLSWLILLNLLVKPVWILFIDRQVQNITGFEVYGQYFAVLNLSLVLFSIADAGLSVMLNQRMALQRNVDVSRLLRIKLVLVLLYGIACCLIAALAHLDAWKLLVYVILIQVATSIFVFLRSIITANQYFTTDAFFSIVDKLLMILICGMMIYTTFFVRINLYIFLEVQLVCTVVAVLLASVFIIKRKLITGGEKESIKSILEATWPFAVCILLMSVHYRIDGFLLQQIHTNGNMEAGRYAAAYRLLDASNMVGYLAASFLVPFVARNINDKALVNETVIRIRHGLVFLSVGIVSFAAVFAPWIQHILYHSSEPYLSRVISFCLAALPGYYFVHVYGSVLTATGRLITFMRILLVTVIINVVLNLLLIPQYGALGCCFAAITSQYFCGMATFYASTKGKADVRSFIGYFALTVILYFFFYAGNMIISNVWVILAIAIIICLLLLAIQLGFFKKKFVLLR